MWTRVGVAVVLFFALLMDGASAQASPGVPADYRDAWVALLHHKDDGGWQSAIQDPSFFLDPEGPHDPNAEWRADLRAFLADKQSADQEPARCRFPARFTLMAEALKWPATRENLAGCVEFNAFRRRLDASSLSVVFVAHHVNNPASAFGHAMLYLGSNGERRAMLADYSVSFEADTEGMSAAEYVPRGLFGGLVAGYQIAPLHDRVRRYEREEQRDLWLLPLRLSQARLDQLVAHLWELRRLTFHYGFFRGNCAQKILSLVQAVAPEYDVLPFRKLAVLPSEVVRRLVEKIGLAGEPLKRPSLSSQYDRQLANLRPSERAALTHMLDTRTVARGASPGMLHAALIWSEVMTPYRAFRREGETTVNRDLTWRRALWSSLANMDRTDDGDAPLWDTEIASSFLKAHRPTMYAVRGGYDNRFGPTVGFKVRWLLHGAIDPRPGFPPASGIEIGRIDVEGNGDGQFRLNEATALRVENLASTSAFQSRLAWKLDLGARRLAMNGESPLHLGIEFDVGVGVARRRSKSMVVAYSMIGARPGAAFFGDRTTFLPAGIWSGGVLLGLPGILRARLSAERSVSLSSLRDGGTTFSAVIRKRVARDWDLELTALRGPDNESVAMGFVLFR